MLKEVEKLKDILVAFQQTWQYLSRMRLESKNVFDWREQREAMFREVEMYEEQRRQREQQEGTRGDVDMKNVELFEASTTPTSLEEPSFFTSMVDELREGVGPHARIAVEAAMEVFKPSFEHKW